MTDATAMRARARGLADIFAAATAALVPWSTSATLIAVAVWFVAILVALRPGELRETMRHPAVYLPVALVAAAAAGTLWAEVAWAERLRGLDPFLRLLLLPLLFAQYRSGGAWRWMFAAFLASCIALLAISFAGMAWHGTIGRHYKTIGVPVRDYIAQSGEFILCAAGLLYVTMQRWQERRFAAAATAAVLAVLFAVNVAYVAPSRTGLVTIPLLFALFAVTQFRLRQMLALLACVALFVGAVWISSTKVQERITGIFAEVQNYRLNNAETSAGLRVEFWQQALKIIATAPVIGHGTGSVVDMFAKAHAAEAHNSIATPTVNPHNQTFMIAIQLGFLGALLVFAMWLAHLRLFLRDRGLAAWIGLAVVVQNFAGCLFNNHLFDFAQAWIYVFGVGAAGGAVLARQADVPSRASQRPSTV